MRMEARTWLTPKQRAELWERWKSGQCVADIAGSAGNCRSSQPEICFGDHWSASFCATRQKSDTAQHPCPPIAKLIGTHRMNIAYKLLHLTDFLILCGDYIVTLPEGRATSLHCLSVSPAMCRAYQPAMNAAKPMANSKSV